MNRMQKGLAVFLLIGGSTALVRIIQPEAGSPWQALPFGVLLAVWVVLMIANRWRTQV